MVVAEIDWVSSRCGQVLEDEHEKRLGASLGTSRGASLMSSTVKIDVSLVGGPALQGCAIFTFASSRCFYPSH
jgi:hypothetical protein